MRPVCGKIFGSRYRIGPTPHLGGLTHAALHHDHCTRIRCLETARWPHRIGPALHPIDLKHATHYLGRLVALRCEEIFGSRHRIGPALHPADLTHVALHHGHSMRHRCWGTARWPRRIGSVPHPAGPNTSMYLLVDPGPEHPKETHQSPTVRISIVADDNCEFSFDSQVCIGS